ncbi:serine hydrolase [Streptomyces sp. NBC_00932]|uniref:serine hydrolase n=1 Tax=Streptomyces sp. NBC_00932 TaxID=2903690 RepID=UPI0038657AC3|nr:serine hydrolase [Streptomyces sp. NBC_00932]
MSGNAAGGDISRRGLGGGMLALGGALALASLPLGPAAAAAGPAAGPGSGHGADPGAPNSGPNSNSGSGSGSGRTTLRRGTAEQAGLLPAPLRQLVSDARAFLVPSPTHPWYAGAVLLAGRGGTVALHEPIGHAVRYSAYDEKSDTGVEFPADEQIAADRDTLYDLASVSKLFTSLVAVQQIERGTLELTAKVASYLPEFGAAGKGDMTVRQLLTHTSGFRATLALYKEPTREGRLRMLWNEAPINTPGTAYLYSDLNLISLQLVLERITGRTLDVLVREGITAPLGMHRTRYNPPAAWKPRIAATEDARRPWSGLDRGLVWGEVHDENAYSFGGVAGHAGVFSCAWDLAVLARTLLNGGAYGPARILRPDSVGLLFTDFNTAFPGDNHGLGFELYQHWYMGAMATPSTAGHTGFTGTSLVLDPSTDSFLIMLGNSVHPVRNWRTGSAPRVQAGNSLARAVPVRPAHGRTAWFSGMASATTATLTLPAVVPASGRARLGASVWWDSEPHADFLFLEASADTGAAWQPVPFSTTAEGQRPENRPAGSVDGWSGRVWHRLEADLTAWRGKAVRLRWRYTTDQLYVGRGAYVTGIVVGDGRRTVFDEARASDAARIEATGWVRSAD